MIGKSYLTGQWFSLGPTVSSTNKTNRHDIAEILLKVALNTIKPNQTFKAGLTVLYIDRWFLYRAIDGIWERYMYIKVLGTSNHINYPTFAFFVFNFRIFPLGYGYIRNTMGHENFGDSVFRNIWNACTVILDLNHSWNETD